MGAGIGLIPGAVIGLIPGAVIGLIPRAVIGLISGAVIVILRKHHLLRFRLPKISTTKFFTQVIGRFRAALKRHPWRVRPCAAIRGRPSLGFLSEKLRCTIFLPQVT